MSATRPSSTRSLGAELERDRLELRVRRVTVAIAALRERASEQRRTLGAPSSHVRRTIADFDAQLEAMNARLRDLTPDAGIGR
jgi:hypothetical protein